jgi:hypothetical protein
MQEAGFRTCSDSGHRTLEKAYFKHGNGIFKLRERLKKAEISVSSDSLSQTTEDLASSLDDTEALVEATLPQDGDTFHVLVGEASDTSAECEGKSEAGNRKLRAFFGRRHTHNEQVMMRPCGVILARATFFGSEAVSAVNVRNSFFLILLLLI